MIQARHICQIKQSITYTPSQSREVPISPLNLVRSTVTNIHTNSYFWAKWLACLITMYSLFADLLLKLFLLHIHMHSDISISAMKYVCCMKQRAQWLPFHIQSHWGRRRGSVSWKVWKLFVRLLCQNLVGKPSSSRLRNRKSGGERRVGSWGQTALSAPANTLESYLTSKLTLGFVNWIELKLN